MEFAVDSESRWAQPLRWSRSSSTSSDEGATRTPSALSVASPSPTAKRAAQLSLADLSDLDEDTASAAVAEAFAAFSPVRPPSRNKGGPRSPGHVWRPLSSISHGEDSNDFSSTESPVRVDRHEMWTVNTRVALSDLKTMVPKPSQTSGGRRGKGSSIILKKEQPSEEDLGALPTLASIHHHIRQSVLGRFDELPDHLARRRRRLLEAKQIRIFVALPGSGRLALWVPPDIRVGPAEAFGKNRFTDFWGEGADLHGPYAGKDVSSTDHGSGSKPPSPATGERAPKSEGDDSRQRKPSPVRGLLSERSFGAGEPYSKDLKSLVAAATGIPVAHQKLVFRSRGPLDDDRRRLSDYDVRNNATLHLCTKPGVNSCKGRQFLASPALAKAMEATQAPRLLERIEEFAAEIASGGCTVEDSSKVGSRRSTPSRCGRRSVEPLPDWQTWTKAPRILATHGGVFGVQGVQKQRNK